MSTLSHLFKKNEYLQHVKEKKQLLNILQIPRNKDRPTNLY